MSYQVTQLYKSPTTLGKLHFAFCFLPSPVFTSCLPPVCGEAESIWIFSAWDIAPGRHPGGFQETFGFPLSHSWFNKEQHICERCVWSTRALSDMGISHSAGLCPLKAPLEQEGAGDPARGAERAHPSNAQELWVRPLWPWGFAFWSYRVACLG